MKQSIWTRNYDVNTIVLDDQKWLGLFGLLNILQDIAWLHAKHLGWGYETLVDRGTAWVLVRQKLVMADWPVWGDVVEVRTWPRGVVGAMAIREFEIVAGDRKFGECSTSWLIIDAQTRRPTKIDREAFRKNARTEGCLAIEAGKIAPQTGLKPAATFQVRNSDLDVNGHVNNTRYAKWIVDSLSPEEHAGFRIEEYEVNFLSETLVGDVVEIERGELVPSAPCPFQGRRTRDDKPVFTARLSVTPRQ
jgi:medium-chain acyl-[acyl-carrier-protein] hydrolase